MSRYAWFVCEDCKEMIWLGKIVQYDGKKKQYFHIGGRDKPSNSMNVEFTKLLMKFIAEHAEHTLRVWPEEMLDKYVDEHFIEIGADDSSIKIDDYINGFPG